ncbi:siphovirus Gp157 family protein [Brevibacillus laterosporus]|uniref:Siphovirus Gp157 family protein n=1 Tax=Brevibacillus halotolerans TaxID=1507437 RepID=A0ABT4I3K1_9BACL|nr:MULTISPECIES: siphovirus Gp157 family protein [Brevibacillus]MCR8987901.1 siphovirus Gp157 family protein [Brevibacillus laterosporus]MCZ0833640.1 siphovirus Gp157 family protein [Brevibacillus halotolerans]
MRLYDLAGAYAEVAQIILDDETPTEALVNTLQALEDAIENKADNIAKMVRNIAAEVDVIKLEEARLAERRRRLEKKQEGLKLHLKEKLEFAGLKKVQTPIFTISVKKNPGSVQVVNENEIPQMFWVTPPPILDKKSMSERLKSGEEIPGVTLVKGTSLQIK